MSASRSRVGSLVDGFPPPSTIRYFRAGEGFLREKLSVNPKNGASLASPDQPPSDRRLVATRPFCGPLRPQTGDARRPRSFPGRLLSLRSRREHEHAHPLPGDPGAGRRSDPADRHRVARLIHAGGTDAAADGVPGAHPRRLGADVLRGAGAFLPAPSFLLRRCAACPGRCRGGWKGSSGPWRSSPSRHSR